MVRDKDSSGLKLGLAMVAGAAILWGTGGVGGKLVYGLTEINALTIGFLRLALSVPFLFAAAWFTLGGRLFQVTGVHLALMALFGAMMAVYQVSYFAAIRHVGVAIATLVALCTAPVLVALLSWRVLGEAITGRTVAAMALAVAGVVCLVGFSGASAILPGHGASGVVLAFGAAMAYAVVVVVGRVLAPHYAALHSATVGFAIGALLLAPVVLSGATSFDYPPLAWSALVFIGLVPTALAYTLFFRGMRHIPATQASVATMLEPLTAALLAWAMFGESLGLVGLAGAALLLGAVFVLYRGAK